MQPRHRVDMGRLAGAMEGAPRRAVCRWIIGLSFGTHHPSVAQCQLSAIWKPIAVSPCRRSGALRLARKGFRSRIPLTRDNALSGEAVVEARDAGLRGENFLPARAIRLMAEH